jgi:serine/threonine protein kinase
VFQSGAFADVKVAISRKTGKKFAIKIIDKQRLNQKSTSRIQLKREIEILQQLKHVTRCLLSSNYFNSTLFGQPNVITIEDFVESDKFAYILLPL